MKLNLRRVYKLILKHRVVLLVLVFLWVFFVLTLFSYWKVNNTMESQISSPSKERVVSKSRSNREQVNTISVLNDPKMMSISSHCNPPSGIEVNAELLPQIALERHMLSLASVVVVIRHGDRGPLRNIKNLASIACDPFAQQLKNKGQLNFLGKNPFSPRLSPTVVSLYERYKRAAKSQLNRVNRFSLPFDLTPGPTCRLGHLTVIGAIQHLTLGRLLGNIYKSHLNLPSDNEAAIKAYTTAYPRTFQSALALLYGFLDPTSSLDFTRFPRIRSTSGSFFCSTPEYCSECDKISQLTKDLDTFKKETIESHPAVNELMTKLRDSLLASANDSRLFASPESVFDGLNGYLCHGSKLPCKGGKEAKSTCASLDEVRHLISFINHHYKRLTQHQGFIHSNWLRVRGFLNQLVIHFDNLTSEMETKSRLVLYSAHDITVTPIASALGFFDGNIPPYASRIIFEVYDQKVSETKATQLIRIIYNGKDVTKYSDLCRNSSAGSGSPSGCLRLDMGLASKPFYAIPTNYFQSYVTNKFNEITHTDGSYSEACKGLQ